MELACVDLGWPYSTCAKATSPIANVSLSGLGEMMSIAIPSTCSNNVRLTSLAGCNDVTFMNENCQEEDASWIHCLAGKLTFHL